MEEDRFERLVVSIILVMAWGFYRQYDPRILFTGTVAAAVIIIVAAISCEE
jgi:hypothetical protein